MSLKNITGSLFADTNNETNCDTKSYFEYLLYVSAANTVTAFIGNFLVVLIICRNKSLQTVPNYFVVSMSVSDLVFQTSFMLVLVTIFSDKYRKLKLFSDNVAGALKHLTGFSLPLSFAISIQSFMAISIHRFYAVVYPLKARIERHNLCALVIFLNWLAAFAIAALESFMADQRKGSHINAKDTFNILKVVVCFVTFIVATVFYSILIVRLRRQKLPGNSSTLQEKLRRKQSMRLTIMFLLIIVVFFFTWITFGTLLLVFKYFNPIDNCTGKAIAILAQILAEIHTTINPAIYFVYCRNYRQGLKVALACCTKLLPRGIKPSPRIVNNTELTTDNCRKK